MVVLKASTLGCVICVVVLLQQLSPTEGKVQRGYIDLRNGADSSLEDHHWEFVSKFGYAIGEGQYRIRARLLGDSVRPDRPYLDFHVFLDEHWDNVETLPSCSERSSKARRTQPLYLADAGKWSSWTAGTLSQKVRPHIWYFAVSDCNQQLSGMPLAIEYEIRMTQVDGSEFSVEMKSMMAWNALVLLCLVVFIVRFYTRCHTFALSAGGLHQVIWILIASISLQFAAHTLHTMHLWSYQTNGTGIRTLDIISEVLFMLSQVVQTTLLIAIAMGYTLLPGRDGRMVIVKCIALLSLVIHVVLVSFAKLQEESACKYHENEGAVGWVLLSVRVLLLSWFAFATQASQTQGGVRLHEFFQHFRLAGSIYFLAYPVLFVVVQAFAPYLQQPIMHIGLLAMQTASNVWLAELFLSRGMYFKVSALNTSLLPGGPAGSTFDKLI